MPFQLAIDISLAQRDVKGWPAARRINQRCL
jgi:hypothetical protein